MTDYVHGPKWGSTLEKVFDEFEAAVVADPSALSTNNEYDDTLHRFKSVAIYAHKLFMYHTCVELESGPWSNEQIDAMARKFDVSRVGFGLIARFAEIGALTYIRDIKTNPESSAVADTVRNSYSTIDDFFRRDASRADRYKRIAFHGDNDVDVEIVTDGAIKASEKRLTYFKVMSDGSSNTIRPVDIPEDLEPIPDYTNRCPIPGHAEPDNGVDYGRKAFDILIGHIEQYVYPAYLPIAAEALRTFSDTERRLASLGLVAADSIDLLGVI